MSSRVAAMADQRSISSSSALPLSCLAVPPWFRSPSPFAPLLLPLLLHRAALLSATPLPPLVTIPFCRTRKNVYLFCGAPGSGKKKTTTARQRGLQCDCSWHASSRSGCCPVVPCSCGSGFTDWSRKAAEEAWGRCAKQGEWRSHDRWRISRVQQPISPLCRSLILPLPFLFCSVLVVPCCSVC